MKKFGKIYLNMMDIKRLIQDLLNHSIKEAERQTGFNHTNISACCRGKLKTLGGCIWRYA